jgi:hypothetical protein
MASLPFSYLIATCYERADEAANRLPSFSSGQCKPVNFDVKPRK